MKCGICQEEMSDEISASITIRICQQYDHYYTHAYYNDTCSDYVYTVAKTANNIKWIITYNSKENKFSIMTYDNKNVWKLSLLNNLFNNIITITAQNNNPLFALSILDRVIESKTFL